ncbi:MAG: tripartite tricarboxylate transporter substrate binding protein [Pseudomonadota bacterium]
MPRHTAHTAPALVLCSVLLCALCLPAAAQVFPPGPVKLVLTNPPGGSSDLMGRMVGQKLSEIWKQSVTIENRAGGNNTIGMEYAMRQPADGTSFVIANMGASTVTPLMVKTRYDTEKDFAPVSIIAFAPSVLVVNASSPYKTLADVVAAARANPAKLNYGTASPGSISRTGVEMLMHEAELKITNVPYTGGIGAINALLGSQIDMVLADIQPAMPQIQGGKLRPLAVTSVGRSPQLPDVPSFTEAGFPGVVANNSWSAFMPARTPPAVVSALNASLRQALADPELVKKFDEYGMEPKPSSPEELRAFSAGERAKYQAVIKQMGLERE